MLLGLYSKGISTGQFEEALSVLPGHGAPCLPASTVRRLVAARREEHERWQYRDLSRRRFIDSRADGVDFTTWLDRDRQCLLLIIGARADGNPHSCCRRALPAIEDRLRESAQSCCELPIRLRDENALKVDPEGASGDGALGFG